MVRDAASIADQLQAELRARYDLPDSVRASDHLLSDPRLLPATAQPAPGAREALLLQQDEQGLAVSLYVHPEILAAVEAEPPTTRLCSGNLDAFCVLLEGVSHLTMLACYASHDRHLAPVDLELQAEVDKFVIGRELLRRQGEGRSILALRCLLFRRWRLRSGLPSAERDRYRFANRWAARYCARLDHAAEGGAADAGELRRFYRMGRMAKLDRIRSLR